MNKMNIIYDAHDYKNYNVGLSSLKKNVLF